MKAVKNLLMLVAMQMVAGFAFAQTWMATGVPSNHWQAVASSADGNTLITAGFSWIYCISTNSGSTWTTNTQPQKGSSYGGWYSIAISADGTKIVGTVGNAIWVSTNSGTTWLSNNVPDVSYFSSVALSADGNKLVAGVGNSGNTNTGSIYTSTNSGVFLTQTMSPTNNWISVASSADGNKLVAATINFQGGLVYVSTNSGLDWALSGAVTNKCWSSVASSADGAKLVAASGNVALTANHYGSIYTSQDFGTTWTSNKVPVLQWNSVASSADGTKLVAVAAESAISDGLIYISTNSGVNWISNNVPSDTWVSVASSADGNNLLVAPIADQSFNPAPIYISQATTPPQLNLTPSITNLALSWIIPSTNFVLQQNLDLTTTNWVTLTNTPTLNLTNLQNQVILSPSNSSGFYRLKTP
jgi:hypothetical protein